MTSTPRIDSPGAVELAHEHKPWYLDPDGPICFGCWNLHNLRIPYPCENLGVLPGMVIGR